MNPGQLTKENGIKRNLFQLINQSLSSGCWLERLPRAPQHGWRGWHGGATHARTRGAESRRPSKDALRNANEAHPAAVRMAAGTARPSPGCTRRQTDVCKHQTRRNTPPPPPPPTRTHTSALTSHCTTPPSLFLLFLPPQELPPKQVLADFCSRRYFCFCSLQRAPLP